MEYSLTIGLEIHAELRTRTKLFCNSKNDPDEKSPNTNVCPICMVHPGTLPFLNKEAISQVLKVGVALGADIADYTEFDRKNYFYPDIPKGYQISQYKYPLVSGGSLNDVLITRIHLEEDTARSSHEGGSRSLIDFNRAGVPLMELVTEPVIHSSEEAVLFAKELQLLLRTLKVGEANMEKGEMRVEANISVGIKGERGTKVEVKNLNSFRSLEEAINYEFDRQVKLIREGGKVLQETRGWNEKIGETFSQRIKEDSHDYRYFPDPDLPKLKLSMVGEFDKNSITKSLPELPSQKRDRYQEIGLKNDDFEVLIQDLILGEFFDEVIKGREKDFSLRVVNYLTSDVLGLRSETGLIGVGKLTPKTFCSLIEMSFDGRLSSRGVKDVLATIFVKGGDPAKVAKDKNLVQKNDSIFIVNIVDTVIGANPLIVDQYKKGKKTSIEYLVGQTMKESRGAGNPQLIKQILEEKLK